MSDDELNIPVGADNEADAEATLELWPALSLFCEIPREFHSLADGPFTRCIICDSDLIGSDARYFIERIFRGTEPIIEYAMCFDCHDGICSELSEDSMQSIQAFYAHVDFDARFDRLRTYLQASLDDATLKAGYFDQSQVDVDIRPWLDTCLVTDKPRKDCRGHQIIAMCQGSSLELSAVPIMLSDTAIEGMVKGLSKKTRDRLDDFIGDCFGMPPEYCESPDGFPLIV